MPYFLQKSLDSAAERKFPEFFEFSSRILPRILLRISPNFSRTFRASFRGRRRPEKIHQKSPPFFNAKFPGKHEENIHKILLESRQSKVIGKSHPWTNTGQDWNFQRTFRTIGPYEFPQEKVWTNDWSIWISPEISMDQWRSKFSESFSLDRYWSIECSSLSKSTRRSEATTRSDSLSWQPLCDCHFPGISPLNEGFTA